jgi:hypothetical protein
VILEVAMVLVTRVVDPLSRARRHRNNSVRVVGGTPEVV